MTTRRPTLEQLAEWEQRIKDGESPGDAARAMGYGGSSSFRHYVERHDEAITYWTENSKSDLRVYVIDTLVETVERAMADGDDHNLSVAQKGAELIGKSLGVFVDKVAVDGRVEVGNQDVAAAIDRFSVTIQRLAARREGQPGEDLRLADGSRAELAPGDTGG